MAKLYKVVPYTTICRGFILGRAPGKLACYKGDFANLFNHPWVISSHKEVQLKRVCPRVKGSPPLLTTLMKHLALTFKAVRAKVFYSIDTSTADG